MLEIFKTLARSVFGMNHVANHENQYLEIVGNGLDAEHPRNARTLDIAGNEVLAGRLTVGAQPEGDNDVATKKYVDDNALPAVTAADNGDVLTVVEGAWAKAAPSGGASVMFVDSTYDDATETNALNKTFNEIYDAITNGTIVYIVTRFENDDIDYCGIANIMAVENGVSVWYNPLNYYVYYAASGDDYPATVNDGGGGDINPDIS